MVTFTVTLTDTENKAMEWCAASVQDWVDNALHNRARIASEEIVSINVAHCNANGIAIGVGITAQVEQAYNLGIVTTAAARNAATPTT
jgi:hypothetical protein|tara:strand:- start:313 stop:576 length:264 start_codon:yes stop_codon:yes gene_type:complete